MKKLPLFLFFIFILLPFYPDQAFPASKDISVLLVGETTSAYISGTGMRFTDSEGKAVSLSGDHRMHKRGPGLISSGKIVFRMPLKVSSDAPLKYNGNAYHGDLAFKNTPSGFRVSNVLPLEQYLRGVIKSEMDPRWPIEAVKAQCILARTFAVRAGGKHGEDDLCASYHCQVYKGIAAEDRLADRAIEETSGLILRWRGSPASVYYHSDSGGMVTSTSNVWGGDTPYLKPKAEPFSYTGPNSEWETTVSAASIQSKLSSVGINVGSIISIVPVKRDETGRVLSMEIKGSSGTKVVSGFAFRNIVGVERVKSTLFEFGARSPYINEERGALPPIRPSAGKDAADHQASAAEVIDLAEMPEDKEEKVVWLTKKRVFTTLELMEILSRPEEIDKYLEMGIARAQGRLPMPDKAPGTQEDLNESAEDILFLPVISYTPRLSMSPASGPSVRILGRGSGHGVGMSQWGAKAMAEKGWTFSQILEYYFPGTTIGQ